MVWESGLFFLEEAVDGASCLPLLFGGAKELGIVYINIIKGAKEPRNLHNHRGVVRICVTSA